MNDTQRQTSASSTDPGIAPVLAHRLAHEVRSPLGVVQGALEQIVAKDDSSSAMARLAQRSCTRLVRLANRLDRIATLGQPPAAGQDGPVQASQVLLAALDRAQSACARSRIEVDTDLAADPQIPWPLAEALTVAVEEVAHNAISHARTRMVLSTSVTTDPQGRSTLHVHALDDGRGFDPQRVTFRPPTSVGSGLGLGLWIARSALRGHDATLDLVPGPDGGSRAELTMVLPTQVEAP